MKNLEYAGFWIRVGASLIDTLILLLVLMPLIFSLYGLNSSSMEMSNGSMNYYESSYSFQGNGNFL